MRKLDLKLIALCVLLPLQFLLVVFYILSTPTALEYYTGSSPRNRILESRGKEYVISKHKYQVSLNESLVEGYYSTYNGLICYNHGTDTKFMNKSPKKCVCKKGWHSKDCGQPEVIWRAFVTSRQEILPSKRKTLRRIIYVFPVSNIEIYNVLIETIFHELSNVVDLFIVYQLNSTQKDISFFPKQLKKSLSSIHHKIIYVSLHVDNFSNNLWHNTNGLISNLQQDDLIVMMDSDKLPNSKALLYFKLYDGWPQPIAFRLRWSVYGFFWQHPKLTSTAYQAAFTHQFLGEVIRHKTNQVSSDMSDIPTQLIVGDLNHYGGWYCSWCLEPKDIITLLQAMPRDFSPVDWNHIQNKKIDFQYIQDLIGTGLWFDGVTVLLPKVHHKDKYFAPNYVLNNSWQYESLLTNLYAYDYN